MFSTMSTDSVNTHHLSPYFENFRRDVVAAVPLDAKCVLSLGCAAGTTEAELVNRGMKVVGVEINPEAAKVARQRGLTVLEGDVSEVDIGVTGEFFDCVIYADILEYLPDPVAVLKRHVKYLKPDGIVYVSIPNFRHYSLFWELFVRGHVRYKDAGILDRTHFRITTRKMVLEWFEQVGLALSSCTYIIYRRRDKLLSGLLLGLVREFIASQICLVGRKS